MWQNDLKKSNELFMQCVWPLVADYCGGGKIIDVETASDRKAAQELDIFAGVDLWQVVNGQMRGIASRVQWSLKDGRDPWNTFTIRSKRASGAKTELSKRQKAISDRWTYPPLTIQAYVDITPEKPQLLTFASIETSVLYEFVRVHKDELPSPRQSYDGRLAKFDLVPWSLLQEHGVPVLVLANGRRGIYEMQCPVFS
jgi:transglutaminase-like putative cysteine protease